MPEYQPLSAPLNSKGQHALAALLQSQSFRHLKTHLKHASLKLTDTAGEANDRLTEAQQRFQRRQQQRRREAQAAREGQEDANEGDGNQEEDDEEAQELAQKEEKVKEITAQLEEKMREVVDAEVKLEGLTNVLGDLAREAEAAEAANAIRTRTRRGGRRRNPDEMDEDDEEDQDYEASPERELGGDDKPPSQQLQQKLAENTEKWEGLSLTQRYVFPHSWRNPSLFSYCEKRLTSSGTLPTTTTSDSTGLCTTPNIPETISLLFLIHPRGFRISKTPARPLVELHLPPDAHAADATALRHLRAQKTSPSSVNASR